MTDPIPLPVLIAESQTPVPVVIESHTHPERPRTVNKADGQTLSPTTTEAEDRTTQGQRRINLIWEITQAFIAISVTGITVYVLAVIAVNFNEVGSNQLIAAGQLNVMATLILSFYFSRTNHAAIGGVGPKPSAPYEGR